MPTTPPTQENVLVRNGDVTAPNWELVPFEVGCPRCGHDLRGLNEPKCPACGSEIDWSKAVPIEQLICRKCGYHLYGLRETRCPECGESFTWEQALDDYHRRQKPLFEYRWREEPFRLLARSWLLSLQPTKLWTWIDLHDPPRPRPLLWIVVIALAVTAFTTANATGLMMWLVDRIAFPYGGSWAPGPANLPSIADLPSYLSDHILDGSTFAPLLPLALWWLLSLAALMIFQQSMRLAKVRAAHIIRVWVFSVVLLSSTAVVVAWLPTLTYLALSDILYWRPRYGWTASSAFYVACCFYPSILWGVRQGYRFYLRMPHSLAVVIASQIIVILALLTLFGPTLILR